MPPEALHRAEYIRRINKVIDHAERNLSTELNLRGLAEIACFSPFHFHRLFALITGEPPMKFIHRIRMEKAACLLFDDPVMTSSEIAFRCGFASSAVFCRAFRKHYGMTPTQLRATGYKEFSKIRQTESNKGKYQVTSGEYLRRIKNTQKWRLSMKTKIEVKSMPEWKVIYCRHVGAFNEISKAYEKVFRWAGAHGLLDGPDFKSMTVYHDDPKVTELSKLRQSACITVKQAVSTSGEIGSMTVAPGLYAVGRFEIDESEFPIAWDSMCVWLADSGYLPAEGYPYELYHADPKDHPEGKFVLDICIPVKTA